ncbi:MAG: hypothetical protein NTW21_06410 [Verrucomicrobia bacterium]|nr:hypothetical protein [Verrucomicrobiota bacterium]
MGLLLDFAVRAGPLAPTGTDPLAGRFYQVLAGLAPACAALPTVLAAMPEADPAAVAERVMDGITRGFIRPRLEPVEYSRIPSERPALTPPRTGQHAAAAPPGR